MSPVEFASRAACEEAIDALRDELEFFGKDSSLQDLEDVSRLVLKPAVLEVCDVDEALARLNRLLVEMRWVRGFVIGVKDAAP